MSEIIVICVVMSVVGVFVIAWALNIFWGVIKRANRNSPVSSVGNVIHT
jgi:hypothetical protein